MSLRKKGARGTDDLVDGLVDDFQRDDDHHSEAESTALTSVFPIVKSSQVRANAPRADVLGTTDRVALATNKKDDNASKVQRDMDALTVDTGRPIDSVYIYPSESQTASHRQRRSYKSGNRSVNSGGSRGSISIGERTGGSVGGILETLGLNTDRDMNDDDESTMGEFSSVHQRSLITPAQGRTGPSRRPNRPGGNSSGPQVHLRACMVLFLLFSILYGAFQWIAMIQTSNKISRSPFRRASKIKKQYKAFDEGEDRPMNPALLGRITDPHLKQLASGNVKPKLYLEKDEKEAIDEKADAKSEQDDIVPVIQKEDAPVDTLKKIDEADPEKGVPQSVQTGLGGIYTKDPTHKDTPLLWYIPRSGGGMVKNILSNCKDLIVASEVGTKDKKKGQPIKKLEVLSIFDHKYVNVDTTTIAGITEAKSLGLVESGLAQLVVSPRLQAASGLFSSSHQARTFTMIRHPVERAVSMFFFLQSHKVPAIMNLTLDEYSKSSHVENNWMVRMLTDHMSGEVGEAELDLAKQVLKEKVLIGLLEKKEESMKRFEYYFGWKYTENAKKQIACRDRFLVGDYRTNQSAKSKVTEGSQAWSLLLWQNKLDMKLYKYASLLYLQQGTELFAEIP